MILKYKKTMKTITERRIFVILFLLLISSSSYSQTGTKLRPIILLDLSVRNSEGSVESINSLEYMAQLAGIPYIITSDVSVAVQYNMIITSSIIKHSSFTTVERTNLINYVDSGGILITPSLSEPSLYSLFGVSSGDSTSKLRYSMKWNWQSGDYSMRWINDYFERTISLGDSIIYPGGTIKTRSYITTTGSTMAIYGDNTIAAVKNNYGQGSTYLLGLKFEDVIIRNQMSWDYEAQRNYSNNFEPSSDVFSLFIKAIYAHITPYASWKHTCPWDYRYEMIMSHDIDCIQSMDTMHFFADYEYQNHIKATYLITTHYFEDDLDIDYYSGNESKILYVYNKGHEIGSHSVGHFPDFDKMDVFPEGAPGNTQSNYHPYYSADDGQTIDGTVFGECEVSKSILEAITGTNVSGFRAGFLAYNEKQPGILDTLGYSYNSSFTANDVLTNFPYLEYKATTTSLGLTNIREIPISFDVDYDLDSLSPTNYISRANRWLQVIQKISDNYAPVIFLLHPVYCYKLLLEEYIYQHLPPGSINMSMIEFSNYWKARDDFHFSSVMLNDSVLQIIVPDTLYNISDNLSLIINDGQLLSNIIVKNQSGITITYHQTNWENNDLCIYFYPNTTNINEPNKTNNLEFINNYPNPFKLSTAFEFFLSENSHIKISIFDESFREIACPVDKDEMAGIHRFVYIPDQLKSGVYFYSLTTSKGKYSGKMVFIK